MHLMLQHKPDSVSRLYYVTFFFCSNTTGCLPSLDDRTELKCSVEPILPGGLEMKSEYKVEKKKKLKTRPNQHQCCVSHWDARNSLSSTFKISCKHEAKVFECNYEDFSFFYLKKKKKKKNNKKPIFIFRFKASTSTLQQRAVQFLIPKRNYEHSLQAQPICKPTPNH